MTKNITGQGISAEKYIVEHWGPKEIWKHLRWTSHQGRFKKIARCLRVYFAEKLDFGETFCEVGCAFGQSTAFLKQYCPGDWLGTDMSKTAIKRANVFFPDTDGLHFACTKTPKVLAQVGMFDGVVCTEVLEHVEEDVEFVAALIAITRKVLVVTTPIIAIDDPGHVRIYDKAMLNKLFRPIKHTIQTKGRFWYVICEQ